MQTGYDNFWMYQSNRPEPVHNLPKNDNYSHPVLTNNYKQSGRYPSNTYFTPSNNVARSQNGQYSSDPRCMWPSSVYSLPFNSPYANNFHLQMFPNQTNNLSYPSQLSQPKPAMRKSSLIEVQKNNYKQTNVSTRLPQFSNYTETDTARIRVKDVFTLSNNSIYNSVLGNNAVQTQKSKQFEYPLNNTSNNCNRTCDFETNEPVLNHIPSSSYVQREQPRLSDQQQFLQYSDTPYKQNAQLSAVTQVQSNGNRQMGSNLQPENFNTRSLLVQLLNQEEVQSNPSNTVEGNKRVTGKANENNHFNGLKAVNSHNSTERNNNIDYCDLSKANETYTSYTNTLNVVQNQNQGNLRNIDQASSLSQVSSSEGSRIATSNATNFSNSRINSLENSVVKITIPHTGQSTFIEFNGLSSYDKSSSLNLPRLLEQHKETYTGALSKNNTQNYTQNNGSNPLHEIGQVRRQRSNTSPGTDQSYNVSSTSIANDSNSTTRNSNYIYCNTKTTPDSRFEQESCDKHSDAFLSFKDCSENTSENVGVNISTENEDVDEFIGKSQAESMPREEIMAIKQERLGVDDPSMQFHQNITIEEEIKTEKYSENYDIEDEPQSSEKPDLLSEDINANKKEESAVSKKIVGKSKTGCKNANPELEIPKKTINNENKSGKNGSDQEANLDNAKERNYVSKINRDKLDLLIQFLKKENDNKTNKSEKNESVNSLKKKEVNSTRSRRKLCKTDIVKNKNNSREMVSLRSHKTSRAETKDSSKHPQTSKTDRNTQEEEKKIGSDEVNKNEKVVGESEDAKSNNPAQDTKDQISSDSKYEPELKNTPVSDQTKESSVDEEKNIINIMQALQNLKTHFCLSCTLVSPVDSFWINVVSGELRCLNCFKKMNLKVDENNLKLKRACNDDCSKNNAKPPPLDKTQNGNENKKDSTENTFQSKCDYEKSNESTKVTEEQSYSSKSKSTDLYNATSRKRTTEQQQKMGESEEKSCTLNDDFSFKTEDSPKVEIKRKRKPSMREEFFPGKAQNLEEKASSKIRKKSNSEESQGAFKQWADSPGKKNTIREEKTKVDCDSLKKEKKLCSQSAENCTSKETYKTFRESLEQETEDSEKSVKQLKEEDVFEVGKREKKQSRKRTISKEEVCHHKVRISEEEVVSAIKSPSRESCDSWKIHTVNELSDKSKSFSKDIGTDQKCKISKHAKTSSVEDSEKKNTSTHKNFEKSTEHLPKKRKKSQEEDLVSRKLNIAEDLTKYSKQCFEKSKSTNPMKGDDACLKHKIPVFDLPRKRNKDEKPESKTEMKNLTESDKSRRNSTSKENLNSPQAIKELKYKKLMSENYEKDKKSFLGKIPRIARKSNETVGSEANKSPHNDEKYQKSSLSTKPLKESQLIEDEMKIATLNETFNKKKDLYENKHKQSQKGSGKEKNEALIQENFEKKERFEKSHTVKQTKKEKALECVFGKKKEDLVLKDRKICPEKPPSAKLLEKLFEKTKKLSWSLLGES